MSNMTDEAIRNWIAKLRVPEDVREAHLQLWRQGLLTVERRADGVVIVKATEAAALLGNAEGAADTWVNN